MTRWLLLLVVAAAAVTGAAAWVLDAQPSWYERLRYPLRYETIVRGHASNYDLDPSLLAVRLQEADGEVVVEARVLRSGGQSLLERAHRAARSSGEQTQRAEGRERRRLSIDGGALDLPA